MDGTGSLRCLNCGAAVASGEAKFFAEVLVCGDCFVIAARLNERGIQLLKRVGVLLNDTLRWSLTRGKLRFPPEGAETVDDAELLRRIVGLYGEHTTQCKTPTLPASTKSSEPDAETARSN
jgi:hypothetical protein